LAAVLDPAVATCPTLEPPPAVDAGGPAPCDPVTNWLIDCTADVECGSGCGFSCVEVCSACSPVCAVPCQTDADCAGQYIGTLATPSCFLLDAVYGGR